MRGVVVLVVGLMVLGAVPASAEADVVRRGDCSGPGGGIGLRTSWRLGLTDSGDRIEVRFVIRHSLDEPWRIVLRHDGRVFFSDIRTGPFLSPEVQVRRSVVDHEGDDWIVAKAVLTVDADQRCHGHARITP